MLTKMCEMLKIYAEVNGIEYSEAVTMYENRTLTQYGLLNAYLENEGIFGYTGSILDALRTISFIV